MNHPIQLDYIFLIVKNIHGDMIAILKAFRTFEKCKRYLRRHYKEVDGWSYKDQSIDENIIYRTTNEYGTAIEVKLVRIA